MSIKLDDRQMRILNFLLENDHTTYQELAEQLQVSTKTISKAIANLKTVVEKEINLQIVVQPKKGVSLVGDKEDLRKLLPDFEITKVDTSEDRITYVFAKLLNTTGSLKIQDLADELFVSRSTMESTIKEVKKRVMKHGMAVISDRNGLKINASEKGKRKLMSEVLNYYWGGFTASSNKSDLLDLNINLLGEANNFLDKEILKKVAMILNRFMEETQLQFTDYEFQTLAIHLAIALERIDSNNFLLQEGGTEKEILENTSYLIDMLEQAFHFNIPKYEQEYIDIHISAIEKNAMNHNLSETTLPNLDLGEQLKQLVLDELNEFHADAELINNLVLHLNAAVKRLRLGVNIHNPYTEKIKSSFKQAFFLSVDLLEKIEEQFLVRFDDDEIAYVTLHIQSFLDRYRPNKSEVLLVCSSGYGTSKLLEQRINRNFADSIKIKKVLSINELQEEYITDELVISTIPIKNAKFPVVVVSPLMLETDIKRVQRYLKVSLDPESTFFALLDKKFCFFSKQKGDTQKNVLRMITCTLQEMGYAKIGILESATRREQLSSTALNDFAMPHAEIAYVNEPVISIYVNPQGIDWNGTVVHSVFFFALNEQVKPELNSLYETFNEIVSNQQALTTLRASSSFEELVKILKEAV
ncbi:BglG family transcription antiterminator [Enterococcus thailandicus]|uniref:Transcriptional antiterminator n=1 Tax=Enterococcus thailandicus TaxID=417368 RepID=A0A179EQW6_ENTTH|nr:BglG family transcription antiterminator [Enterococcus thailandicus]OAQ55635.1 transcriptional antiterminator [Enterococcus thailandicus]